MSTALIGVGNPFRRDDGIGPTIVAALSQHRLPGVTFTACQGDPIQLLDAIDGMELAVIVDAVRCDPASPGRVHRSTTAHGPAGRGTHGLGVPAALRLAAALGRAPRRVVVLAVEAGDLAHGPGLSPAVAAVVPAVIQQVLAELGTSDRTPEATTNTG